MSVIIGICSRNFATLWADTRLVQFNENQVQSVNDNAVKIFQINEHVLFGCAGYFWKDEQVCDAIAGLENAGKASIKVCKDAILSFLKTSRRTGRVLPVRNYILAGKQKDGTFIMYGIHWDPETKKAKTTQYYPYSGDMNFAMVVALPQAPEQFQRECEDNVVRIIGTSKTYNGLNAGIETLICEISKRNPTVSPKPMSLRVL